ncbi:MAG: substrate-binding domain-containing protein [Propionivibrio sp.]|nr:substrate-binding domain-containing protein [Propionivibrio sp.]
MNNPKCFQFNRLVRVLFLSAFFLLAGTAQAEVIRVSGVGLSAPLMQRLAAAYGQKQTIDSVSVVLPPLGSTGSMRAVSNGKLDLAIAGRLPTPEEQAQIGQMVELARTAFGFATSDGNRPNGITAADVADIYAGRLNRWDDGQPIRLIMRPDRESDTILVRQISAQTDAAMTLAAARKGSSSPTTTSTRSSCSKPFPACSGRQPPDWRAFRAARSDSLPLMAHCQAPRRSPKEIPAFEAALCNRRANRARP